MTTGDQEPVDLAPLTTDQLTGLSCINCNRSGGATRTIPTPGNAWSTHVVAHVEPEVCVRYIARYIAGLHVSLLEASAAAATALDRVTDPAGDDPEGTGPGP
jgi:hypothetical protein